MFFAGLATVVNMVNLTFTVMVVARSERDAVRRAAAKSLSTDICCAALGLLVPQWWWCLTPFWATYSDWLKGWV